MSEDSKRFSIELLPVSVAGPASERLGKITIGDFTERFGIYPFQAGQCVEEIEQGWDASLTKLTAAESAVLLQHDPRFAWVFYRKGQACYIQQMFFKDGIPDSPPPRTVEEDGVRISEWSTSIDAIRAFLAVKAAR